MKNNSNDRFFHIGRAAQLLEELYEIRIDVRRAREAAVRVLHNTGCFRSANYLYRTRVNSFRVLLPCPVDDIVSVTGREVTQDWLYPFRGQTMLFQSFDFASRRMVTPVGNALDPEAFMDLADWSETEKPGVLIRLPEGLPYLEKKHAYFEDFILEDNILTFARTGMDVDIVFEKKSVDESGFPLLTEKAIFAVVSYLVYLDQLKKFYRKEAHANAVAAAREEYERTVAQARAPELLTANQSDALMATLLSKSRHRYGNPYHG